jgi:predicted PurR-regulated permease PerM
MKKSELTPAREGMASGWGSRNNVHALALIAATAIGIYLCYRLTLPFLAAITWALALAILFRPIHHWLETKIKRPNLAASITVAVVGLMVVVAVAFVGQRVIAEAVKGVAALRTRLESGEWARFLEAHPSLTPIGRWLETNTDFSGSAAAAASWLTTRGASLVQGSVMQLAALLLTFYFLFFFLRDRRTAYESLRALSPLTTTETDRLCRRVADTIHATVYGKLTIAVVQGTLGGLMLWWLGVPSALLWGIVMALLSIVPAFGAFIVWVPTAIILALAGSWGKAIILALWGSIVVGSVDNLLYPMLVGNRVKMTTPVTFISVLGGVIVFGGAGVVLGPVIVAVTMSLLEVWHDRNQRPET